VSVRRTALAARRKVVGFSQEGLAERLQVDRATIVRWEKGESLPQPWKRVELAKSLRVSVEQLDELLTEQSPAAAGFESERGVSPVSGKRLCGGCGLSLSRYNTGTLCQSCINESRKDQLEETGEVLIDGSKLAELRREHGMTQEFLAERAGISASLVRKLEQGIKKSASLRSLSAISRSLKVPLDALLEDSSSEISMEGQGTVKLPAIPHMRDTLEELENNRLAEHVRRTFLAGGLAALTLPSLGLDELKHITAAVANAQRYADDDIVAYFKRQLDNCAVNDGQRGPKQSLPIVLGVIAAIEKMVTDSKPAIRRELLRVGAHAAEFAGWLYRDVCIPGLANHWRDRAVEWAQISGDATMQGYVLLKKSQAVWDERDAFRMLTLAEAVQEGPWRLPPRVRAEAAQQQARGHAMLNGNLTLMESKLSEAQSLLDQDRATADSHTTEVAAHYDEALFGLQVAICYCEAGRPDRSLELYDRWLSPETFSRRDYAYFLALKGEAHAIAQEPDYAATAGLEAFAVARETESVRTVQEITRLAVQLGQWSDRESVHDLRKSVLVE
jgi:transcriptional regulator with XRE-family HTH domain